MPGLGRVTRFFHTTKVMSRGFESLQASCMSAVPAFLVEDGVRNGAIRDPLVAWAPNQQGAWWFGSLLGLAPDTFPPDREPSVADDKGLSAS